MHVLECLSQVNFQTWHALALLHTILVYTLVPVNTQDTQEMHVTSSHLICYTTHVVYRYNNYSYRQGNTSVLQLLGFFICCN